MWAGWDRDLGTAGLGSGLQSVVPADLSCLVQMPPCSANLLPRFAASILLNLHTRSSLQMAAPTSFQAAAPLLCPHCPQPQPCHPWRCSCSSERALLP